MCTVSWAACAVTVYQHFLLFGSGVLVVDACLGNSLKKPMHINNCV